MVAARAVAVPRLEIKPIGLLDNWIAYVLVLVGLSLSAEPLPIRAVLVPQRYRVAEPAKYVRSIFNLVRLTNARHAEK